MRSVNLENSFQVSKYVCSDQTYDVYVWIIKKNHTELNTLRDTKIYVQKRILMERSKRYRLYVRIYVVNLSHFLFGSNHPFIPFIYILSIGVISNHIHHPCTHIHIIPCPYHMYKTTFNPYSSTAELWRGHKMLVQLQLWVN